MYISISSTQSAFLSFSDQFGFRPTGSTTAAIITILDAISSLLATNDYILLYALDFSKAFDTVRHSTMLEKFAKLDLPDNIFSWLVKYSITTHIVLTI